jgi:ketosteroid isomerase-like protein
MDGVSRVSDEQMIRETLARYVRYADERNAPGWGALFAEDALFMPRSGGEFLGRAAIRMWFEELFRAKGAGNHSLHMCGNHEIASNGQTAVATSDVVVFERNGEEPWTVCQVNRYVDRLVRNEMGWLFAERRIEGR